MLSRILTASRLMRVIPLALLALLTACGSTPSSNGVVPAGFYRVQAGDTLYRIAKNKGQSVAQLQSWNRLGKNDDIQVGQLLRVQTPSGDAKPAPSKPVTKPVTSESAAPASKIKLVWPAKGKALYAYAPPRLKGIGIGGDLGDPIVAAAAGKVLYAGDGIRGYGLLLIIQHAQGYLTAYAHNQKLLVKEGDQVKQGQNIATMGQTGSDQVKLHFELRFKGQTIDPAPGLPD